MSEIGSILDKLLAHATAADPNYVTLRGARLVTKLNDDDFPHVMTYNPNLSAEVIPDGYLQEIVTGEFTVLIATKDETQEQLLVRVDAYVARIRADRTLTGDVDSARVSGYDVTEDVRSSIKAAEIVIVTTETVDG